MGHTHRGRQFWRNEKAQFRVVVSAVSLFSSSLPLWCICSSIVVFQFPPSLHSVRISWHFFLMEMFFFSQARTSPIFLCMQVAGKELKCFSLRCRDLLMRSFYMVARACIAYTYTPQIRAAAPAMALLCGRSKCKKRYREKPLCHVSNKGGYLELGISMPCQCFSHRGKSALGPHTGLFTLF